MDVSLLGPLVVTTGARSVRGKDLRGAKPRGLLELLLLSRGKSVSKDALADADMTHLGEVGVDLDRFDSLVLRAEHADVVTRRALLNDAVALAHGDLLTRAATC